jgi:pyridoxal 5'-phosphate synthase pdxT subunit
MIGILCLQGNYAAHALALEKAGAEHKFVRLPQDLDACSGLIIPGGESSALLKLMQPWDFLEKIRAFHTQGGAIFGTCAGMILLAKNVVPEQKSLALIDISVQRNAYGRQQESKTITASRTAAELNTQQLQMTLIRAPRITYVGDQVEVLAWDNATPMLVRQGNILAASFHPEMDNLGGSDISCVHKYFIALC